MLNVTTSFLSFLILGLWTCLAAQAKPLKVFILCGQSNMEGHAKISTFEAMRTDPLTKPILKNPQAKGHPAIAYRGSAQTIRTDTHRLIAHRRGELELYDHTTPEGEAKNLADAQPEKAAALLKQLKARLAK